jgi:branched-chain amino acid transport system ATP-binding protein
MSTTDNAAPILQLRDTRVAYGAIEAVKGISLELARGELVSLIGANGAGKTTTLNAIAGTLGTAGGQILYDGQAIDKLPAHKRLRQGLALVPEGRGIFTRLTVEENLRMGAYCRRDDEAVEADMERIFGMLPRVRERLQQVAGTLSGGEQQMVAIGRALLSRPACCCWTSPPWAWRRWWWRRSLKSLPRWRPKVSPCCWWSRTPPSPWSFRAGPT